jgi:hypothetical protein
MEPDELQEKTEHAMHTGQKVIGLTTAIVAVLLATATLMGHRSHTEEIKLQTRVNDGWGFYQAKHSRAYEFGLHAEDAVRAGGSDVARRDLNKSTEEECGVPAEKNCASPVLKDSPWLQKFIKENSASGAADHSSSSASASATTHEGETAHKEKPAKESGKKKGAVDIQEETTELEKETELIGRQANRYNAAELFLEISIVLCSIALLTEAKRYWRVSFITTALGIGLAVWGLLLR